MRRIAGTLIVFLASAAAAGAAPITYTTVLTGAAEFPPNASPGTGTATVIIDTVAHTLEVSASFADLIGTTTAAHIHCCTALPGDGIAGVATETPSFGSFPLGVMAGAFSESYDLTDLSSFCAGFVAASGGTAAGAEAALAAGLAAGTAYFNIHTTEFQGGEIRGFFEPAQVPEPVSLSLLGLGFAAAVARRRRA